MELKNPIVVHATPLVRVLALLAVVQAMALVGFIAHALGGIPARELREENRTLRNAYATQLQEACALRYAMGDSYRVALKELMARLGITKPGSAAETILHAYEGALPVQGGIGGP